MRQERPAGPAGGGAVAAAVAASVTAVVTGPAGVVAPVPVAAAVPASPGAALPCNRRSAVCTAARRVAPASRAYGGGFAMGRDNFSPCQSRLRLEEVHGASAGRPAVPGSLLVFA